MIAKTQVSVAQLVAIYQELDRGLRDMPFETASSLAPGFLGGFDHSSVHADGWGLTLHDRGMNGRNRDLYFYVAPSERTSRRGPLVA